MEARVVLTLLQKELRDSLRNRWFLLYTISFGVLALGLSYFSLSGAGLYGFAGFGRTAASLINLVLLVVPLMGLTVGAGGITGEREHGTLAYLLAHPVSRSEILLGKYLGLAISLLVSLCLGFGISGVVIGLKSGGAQVDRYLRVLAFAYLLALGMLSLGMLISTLSRKSSVAVGVALFLWLVLVFFGDLGLLGTALTMRIEIGHLFTLTLVNPLQAFKVAAIQALHPNLDVLGPAGIYAVRTYGDRLPLLLSFALGGWVLLPLVVAYGLFVGRQEA